MKLFVLPSVYPNEINATSGIYVKEHCNILRALGHEVVILDATAYNYRFWLDTGCWRPAAMPQVFGDGYVWHRRGLMDTRFLRYAVSSYRKNILRLYDLAVRERGKPDLLIAHFAFPSGFVTRELSQREKLPFFVIEHYSLFLKSTLNRYIKQQLNQTIRDSAAYICVSNSLKEGIERHSDIHGKAFVIPNAINPSFQYCPPLDGGSFVFFSAGGTRISKRSDMLIDAFCRAFSPDDPVEMVIAGPGSNWEVIRNKVSSNNRQHQIHIRGRLNREQILKQYQECHCYAMPSVFETFGIVYREAMAVGRPVISVRNGGIEDDWEEGFGILTEKDDLIGFACAMRNVYVNYNKYNLREISERCILKYSVSTVAVRTKQLIEELFSK